MSFTEYDPLFIRDEDEENEQQYATEVIGYIQDRLKSVFYGETTADGAKKPPRGSGRKKSGKNRNSDPLSSSSVLGSRRAIFCHLTCATDSEKMKTVIKDVQIGMVRKMMQKAALI